MLVCVCVRVLVCARTAGCSALKATVCVIVGAGVTPCGSEVNTNTWNYGNMSKHAVYALNTINKQAF